jgi:pantoate--beta-alanine ligase
MKSAALVRAKPALGRLVSSWRSRGMTVAFVPTMGALHSGHAELIRRGARDCDRVVVSVFVNPLQFGPHEDFSRYPRALPADRRLCAQAGAHAVYAPSVTQMYPEGFATAVSVAKISDLYCGKYRPGHFTGVATVVLKLFNQVRPDRAYFGEKDFQQLTILRRMVSDLDVPVDLIGVPTVREADGLALSSRNAYLTPDQRAAAPAFRAALFAAAKSKNVSAAVRKALLGTPLKLQYAAVADARTLAPAKGRSGSRRLLAAAYLGKTRLIDNIPL